MLALTGPRYKRDSRRTVPNSGRSMKWSNPAANLTSSPSTRRRASSPLWIARRRAPRDAEASVTTAKRSRRGRSTNRRAAPLIWQPQWGRHSSPWTSIGGSRSSVSSIPPRPAGCRHRSRSGSSAVRCSATVATTRSSCTTTGPSLTTPLGDFGARSESSRICRTSLERGMLGLSARCRLTNSVEWNSAMSIMIRVGMAADATALAELAARTFRETFAADNRPEDLALHMAYAYGTSQQHKELVDPDIATLLVEVDGQLAGYAQVRLGVAPACVTGE